MIFDSHAHYDDEQFDCDREELLDSMQEHGIGGIINVGASMEGVFASQELAEKYPFIYAGVGIHPDYVGSLNEEKLRMLAELCKSRRRSWSEKLVWIIIGIKKRMIFRKGGLSNS